MSQPSPYAPVTSFLIYQAQQAWFPGQQLDVEFNALKTTTKAIDTNLALLQQDDGTLAHGLVDFINLTGTFQAQLLKQGFVPTTPGTFSTITAGTVFANLLSPSTAVSFVTGAVAKSGVELNVNSFPQSGYYIGTTTGVYSGFTGSVNVPSFSTLLQANGLAGYALLGGGTVTDAVGVFGVGLLSVDSGGSNGVWGGVCLATNSPTVNIITNTGFNFGNLSALELDVNIIKRGGTNPTGNAQGLYINSASEIVPTGPYYGALIDAKGAAKWNIGLVFASGSATNQAILIGASATSGTVNSMSIGWVNLASGTPVTKNQYLDTNNNHFFEGGITTKGGFNLFAPAGGLMSLVCGNTASFFTITFPLATDTVALLAQSQTLTNKTLTSPALTTPTMTTPNITSGGLQIGGITRLADLSSTYSVMTDPTGASSFTLGGGVDKTSYYRNNAHSFQTQATVVIATMTTSGLLPGIDNTYPLGTGSFRWTDVSSVTGTFTGAVTATGFKVSTNQVVGARQTGWTVATGTPQRSTFTTGGVTLAQLAGVVMALEQDLIAHGLIGT